jgi:hypothetical protein
MKGNKPAAMQHTFSPVDVVNIAFHLSKAFDRAINPLSDQNRFENHCAWTIGLLYRIENLIENLQPEPETPRVVEKRKPQKQKPGRPRLRPKRR